MASINLSMLSDTTMILASQPYDTKVTAEQPWVTTKFTLYDSDIEVRSADGFIFQLHCVVLGVTTGAFPGSEFDTGGEMVQLTEPANVLGILFAFLYPKEHPDLHGESFEVLAAVAEAAGKYEVFSAADVCNERLVKFLPQYAPEILVHAVKHDYPRLIRATLPHFARAPFLPFLEKLPPSYMLPWARYHAAWTSLFKESNLYIKSLRLNSASSCHSSEGICETCCASLKLLITHLEEIDTLSTLSDTLRFPKTKYLKSVLACCRHKSRNNYEDNDNTAGFEKSLCPFVESLTELCQDKIEKMPSFATFLGLKLKL